MNRLKILSCLPLIMAAGCATTEQPRGLNVETQTVYVDRPVACVPVADAPVRPAALPSRPADARAALDLAVRKVLEWEGYGNVAQPLLEGCAKP